MEPHQLVVPFDAPHNGSATSKAAAEGIRESRTRLVTQVFNYIDSKRTHGATRDEVERALRIPGNTVRPRVAELLKLTLIRETDRTRETRSGRMAAVLVSNRFAE
jgi:hypothetical protein